MSNLDTLIQQGVVPQDHTLSDNDKGALENLSDDEVQALVALKQKLGDDFLQRNSRDCGNCFL